MKPIDGLSVREISELSIDELNVLADEIRRFLVETTSKTGGHIGANLGVVELTLAVERCAFHAGGDVLFDTGHQGYTHKIVTGRASSFGSLNSFGGMSRFLDRDEHESDLLSVSHAGTALSAAVGLGRARRTCGEYPRPIFCVIGDGTLAEGQFFEALNDLAPESLPIVLVINDNGFAISPGRGAVHEVLKSETLSRQFFTSLGMAYFRVDDGHDLASLEDALLSAGATGTPSVVHCRTTKGHKWAPADAHPYKAHYLQPFDAAEGRELSTSLEKERLATSIVASEVLHLMEQDPRLVLLTPGTAYATGFNEVEARFPRRCFDVGMSEQHALSQCVGWSLHGMLPIAAFQSTFLQRAYDQLIHDLSYPSIPTIILSFRSGLAGYDHPTHHGLFDNILFPSVPNTAFFLPPTPEFLTQTIASAVRDCRSPIIIGTPYDPFPASPLKMKPVFSPEVEAPIAAVQDGRSVLVVTIGQISHEVCHIAREFGFGVLVLNEVTRSVRPEIQAIASSYTHVTGIEEGLQAGGVVSSLVSELAPVTIQGLGFPLTFVPSGSRSEILGDLGLSAEDVKAFFFHLRDTCTE